MYDQIGSLGFNVAQMETFQAAGIYAMVILIAYCLGMISPATMIAKSRGIDIRKEGSGNPGTTNTLRVMGVKAALVVLLVDVLKGTVAVILAGMLIGQSSAYLAALFVFLGHVFPANNKFQGGKGVATAFGALAAINPGLGFGCLGIVVAAVLISRHMSVGSLAGAACCPVLTWMLANDFFWYSLILAAIVLYRHKDNVKRLIDHEEPKISFKRKQGE